VRDWICPVRWVEADKGQKVNGGVIDREETAVSVIGQGMGFVRPGNIPFEGVRRSSHHGRILGEPQGFLRTNSTLVPAVASSIYIPGKKKMSQSSVFGETSALGKICNCSCVVG